MTASEQKGLSMKAKILKAMGQTTRLRNLELLHAYEMQASRISAQVGNEAPTVSRRLAFLQTVADRLAQEGIQSGL